MAIITIVLLLFVFLLDKDEEHSLFMIPTDLLEEEDVVSVENYIQSLLPDNTVPGSPQVKAFQWILETLR